MIRLTTLVTATAGREGFAVHCKLDQAEKAARRARGKKGKGGQMEDTSVSKQSRLDLTNGGHRAPSFYVTKHGRRWCGYLNLLLVSVDDRRCSSMDRCLCTFATCQCRGGHHLWAVGQLPSFGIRTIHDMLLAPGRVAAQTISSNHRRLLRLN